MKGDTVSELVSYNFKSGNLELTAVEQTRNNLDLPTKYLYTFVAVCKTGFNLQIF